MSDFLSCSMSLSYLKPYFNQVKPFSLVHRAEAMVPKVMVPSTHLVLTRKLSVSHDRINDVEALKEKETQHKEQMVVLPEATNCL